MRFLTKNTTVLFIFLLINSYLQSQTVRIIKLDELEKRIHNNSDTTYIVNFWATWCVPCIKELPDFDSIHTAYKNKKVKVLLVSLDFSEEAEKKVQPFLIKKNIKSEVLLLDETNANYFIPKISELWSGAIPATLFINNQKKKKLFFEKKLDYHFIETQIKLIEEEL